MAEERLRELEARREAARILTEQADRMVLAYDAVEEQSCKLRLVMTVLDAKAQSIRLILTAPLLDPPRWQEPEATHTLKRALPPLVHSLTRREEGAGEFHVEILLHE